MGPLFVTSQGNSAHSKHSLTPLLNAQVAILQNLLSLATQPCFLFGQVPFVMLGHFSQAIPHTPIFILKLLFLYCLSAGSVVGTDIHSYQGLVVIAI
jgi:hypothetical protein